MKTILTAAQMKAADQRAISRGVPSLVLMERAALSVVQELLEREGELDLRRVCIFCGTGNNGGDGAAIGRILKDYGRDAVLILVGPEGKYSEAMAQQVTAAKNRGVRMLKQADPTVLSHATLIIDALFGVGLSREVKGEYREAVRLMNDSPAPKVAVDIPSGIHTDTGALMGCAVKCSLTVTFAREKRGLLLFPGAAYAGETVVKEIGIPVETEELEGQKLFRCEKKDLQLLPKREESGHKGTFRKILVIAGSRTMAGAALLCAEAALRSGAGMVKVYTEETNRIPLAVRLPEALVSTYSQDNWRPETEGKELEEALAWADGAVMGPGLGNDETAKAILRHVLDRNSRDQKKPLVLDADALNILAEHPELKEKSCFPAVFTPHMGEMARLTGCSSRELKEDPVAAACRYAAEQAVTLVLKDARTVIAAPDGSCWINTRGNSALATAGSGDVLAGIMGTLFTQYGKIPEVPALAVLIHGLAGERAAADGSERDVTAGDLPGQLGGILP